MTRPHVRTELRLANKKDIGDLRLDWQRRRCRTSVEDTVEEALDEMLMKGDLTPSKLRAYVEHPDERVVIKLLRARPWDSKDEWYVRAGLTVRALRLMEAGEDWNPIADRAQGQMGFQWSRADELGRYREYESLSEEDMPAYRRQDTKLNLIFDYLDKGPDPELEVQLLEYQNWFIMHRLAKLPYKMSSEVFERLLGKLDSAGASILYTFSREEHRFTEPQLDQLGKWVLERINKTQTSGDERQLRELGGAMEILSKSDRVGEDLKKAILAFHETAIEKQSLVFQEAIVRLMLKAIGHFSDEEVQAMAPVLYINDSLAQEAVATGRLPLEIKRQIAEKSGKVQLREELAKTLEEEPDDRLTELLSKSKGTEVQALILQYGTGEGWLQVSNRLQEKDVAVTSALSRLHWRLQKKEGFEEYRRYGTEPDEPTPETPPLNRTSLISDIGKTKSESRVYSPGSGRGWAARLLRERKKEGIALLRLLEGRTDEYILKGLLSSPERNIRMFAMDWVGQERDQESKKLLEGGVEAPGLKRPQQKKSAGSRQK